VQASLNEEREGEKGAKKGDSRLLKQDVESFDKCQEKRMSVERKAKKQQTMHPFPSTPQHG
jgi:hypothetical protein